VRLVQGQTRLPVGHRLHRSGSDTHAGSAEYWAREGL